MINAKILAFNSGKCDGFISGNGGFNRIGISTSQFISSTGDCSMIGKKEHDQKIFIAHNSITLRADIARGNGPYLEAYAELSEIENKSEYYKLLKENYFIIFGTGENKSPEEIYKVLSKI